MLIGFASIRKNDYYCESCPKFLLWARFYSCMTESAGMAFCCYPIPAIGGLMCGD